MGKTSEGLPGSRKIEIESVMVGADVIVAGEEQIALGFPEEVVKAWLRARKMPTAWLIPDVRSARGIVQWALEFPLYHALFVRGLHARGQKIPVLVHRRDWDDVREYLRLSLLGLERVELEALGVEARFTEHLSREREYLALKRPDGSVAPVEDFLDPRFFDDEGMIEFGGLRIRSHGRNTWSFFAEEDRLEEHRLEIAVDQRPPYTEPLLPASAPSLPQPFEVVALGTGTGFDTRGPCTSLLVQANGRSVLIDSGPYVRTLLDHCGVSLNQLGALVLTHAHEDHCVGLNALLGLTHRIKLFTTKETAAIMRRKLAILNPGVSQPGSLLDDAFDLVLVEPGAVYDFYGVELRFHYTMHSIPCTGVEFSLAVEGVTRRALIVGDNNCRAHIERAGAAVLGAARLDELMAIYRWKGDLLLHDAGAGLIHGKAADFEGNLSENVVCVHTHELAAGEENLFSLSRPAHRYTIVPENRRPTALERGLAQRALVAGFEEADPEWLSALLDASSVMNVNRGDLVVRAGEETRDLFVALTGELGVFPAGVAEPVALLQAGEIFGEMAAIRGSRRTATVRARTPARLLRVPGDTFRRFAADARLVETMPDVWEKRGDLQAVSLLAATTVSARNALARRSVRRIVSPGSTLIREGSRSSTVFVLVKGRVQVYKGDGPLMVEGSPVIVEPGSLIGESATWLKQSRNASIVALDECEVLAIRGPDFRRIVRGSPHLFCAVSRIVRDRCAA